MAAVEPCRIVVVDRENGWPVPMVELRTTHNVRFVSDNAGVIAFDLPELMGREVWFDVVGHGYAVPADGFGQRGVRLMPEPGGSLVVEVDRAILARRLGRITGGGIFAESQKLGEETDWAESGILGSDSVQSAVHRGRYYWLWGDTVVPRYPLGIFDATSATSGVTPLVDFEPPVRLRLDYFSRADGNPRAVARLPGSGPTWLTGYVSLPDSSGHARLVASYAKIEPPMDAYERGLCIWNEDTGNFERLRVLWEKSGGSLPPPLPRGHPVFVGDDKGVEWVLYGDPFPTLRHPATFEAWKDDSTWEALEPQESLVAAEDGRDVVPHSGSIAWNEWRGRWVVVFMEYFGEPNAFGEIWYAEADAPTGPWGPAVKVLSHDRYTFYNPRIHSSFTPENSPVLLFEGTFTKLFSDQHRPTPRYDYNQVLYRLDLDDPALRPAWDSVGNGGATDP